MKASLVRTLWALGFSCVVVGCSDASSASSVAPSGVFVRTDDASGKVWLAFDGGKGARRTLTTSGGKDVTGLTCFTYEASGTTVKMTLKKTTSSSNGVSTSSDLGGRVEEHTAAMTPDGTKLDADRVLEDARFTYTRDASMSAADVAQGCN